MFVTALMKEPCSEHWHKWVCGRKC